MCKPSDKVKLSSQELDARGSIRGEGHGYTTEECLTRTK